MKTTHVAAIITFTLGASLQAEPVPKVTPSVHFASNVLNSAVAILNDHVIVGGGSEDGGSPGCAYVFAGMGSDWVEQARLASPATPNSSSFGLSVALGADFAVVGAPAESSQAGRAYVYHRSGTNWTLVATLQPDEPLPPTPAERPQFGWAVAAEGEVIVVGAYRDDMLAGTGPGSAYVFRRVGGVWQKEAKLKVNLADPSNSGLGYSVAICGDHVAVVGIYQDPQFNDTRQAVYLFRHVGGSWQLRTRLNPSEPSGYNGTMALTTNAVVLGCSVGTNAAGARTGVAYVFEKPVAGWGATAVQTEAAKLVAPDGIASDYFGHAVGIEGDLLAVGEEQRTLGPTLADAGRVSIYRRIGGVWSLYSRLFPSDIRQLDYFGWGLMLNAGRLAVGSRSPDSSDPAGAVYLFRPLAPSPPYRPTPSDGVTEYANLAAPLTWTNGEATTTIDLIFNVGSSCTNQALANMVLANVPPVSAYAAPLRGNRYYCWQVIARNAYGETDGPVWDFTTAGPLDFELSTTNLAFGGQPANTASAVRTLDIFNPGRRVITLDISLTNRAFWIVRQGYGSPTGYVAHLSYQVPLWRTSTLEIVFAPTNTGAIADVLTLRTTETGWGNFTNQVLLTGTGLSSAAGAPANPSPPNGATEQSPDTDLHWQNGTGTTAVDLLFSRSGQPLAYLLSNAAPVTACALPQLLYDTTYQWQVLCRSAGGSTPGPVWTFTTVRPLIEVASPNGREVWRVGTTQTIAWKAKNGADTVQLDLYRLGHDGRLRKIGVLATNIPAKDGSLAWSIDPHLDPGDGYLIRIRDGIEPNFSDDSDGPFTLLPTIHVVYPNGGEQVRAGAPCNISWLGEELGGEVSVDILQNGSGYERLGTAPNTGSLVWNVPCGLDGTRFQARVVWRYDESLNDLSDGTFDVVNLPPDKASNPTPADRAENVSRTPTLTWTNGAGTCEVEVWLGLANPPDARLYAGGLTNSFPVSHALRAGAAHYWRVVSQNRAGDTNGPVWSFTTEAVVQPPRLSAPTVSGNHLEFQWTPHQSGVQYRFQSATNLGVAFSDLAVVQTNRYTHTNGATLPARFYRVRVEPLP